MIKINRGSVAMPECLSTDSKSDSEGKRETEAAKRFFRRRVRVREAAEKKALALQLAGGEQPKAAKKTKKRKPKSFEFEAYKGAKPTLRALFNNKCGYCEIDYGGAPSDIEHFRPKGAIEYEHEGAAGKYPEGYYWLAADWTNLIYSCKHCNSREHHDHQEYAGGAVTNYVSGKGNAFPLNDESKRLKPCDPVSEEEEAARLLLDPCRDEPRDHLEFHADGFVTAKLNNGEPSPKGTTSIRVYGLSRVALRDRRRHTASTLLFAIKGLNRDLAEWKRDPSATNKKAAVDTLDFIRTEYLADDRPFLGMAWALFKRDVDAYDLSLIAGGAPPTQPPRSTHLSPTRATTTSGANA
jgi:uncharacterized protein (TIGR02646 family)